MKSLRPSLQVIPSLAACAVRQRARPFIALARGLALAGVSVGAMAHPGHAAEVFHGHASDLFGLAVVVGLGLAALWLARR